MNGLAPLITAALQAGPWAFVGVATLLVGLVIVGAYAYHVRERARARTITDTVSAVSPHGGVVTQKRGRQSLTVALPVPRPPALTYPRRSAACTDVADHRGTSATARRRPPSGDRAMSSSEDAATADCDAYVRERWDILQRWAERFARSFYLGPDGKEALLSDLYVALRKNWPNTLIIMPPDDRHAYVFNTLLHLAQRRRSQARTDGRRHVPLPDTDDSRIPAELQRDGRIVEEVIEQHLLDRVTAAIRDLPDAEHDAFILVHKFGLNQRQASEHLGIPARTVSRRLARAHARLQAVLTADHYDIADLRGGAR